LWQIDDAQDLPENIKKQFRNNVWELYEPNGSLLQAKNNGVEYLSIEDGSVLLFVNESTGRRAVVALYRSITADPAARNVKLILQDDGNLVLYSGLGGVLWATNTNGGKASNAPKNYKGNAPDASGDPIEIL
jgi:hypothetical protein